MAAGNLAERNELLEKLEAKEFYSGVLRQQKRAPIRCIGARVSTGRFVSFALKRRTAPSGRRLELYPFRPEQPLNCITIPSFRNLRPLQPLHRRNMLLGNGIAPCGSQILQRHRRQLQFAQLGRRKFVQTKPGRLEILRQAISQYCRGDVFHSSS
jgi:hypothetical protein